MMSRPRRAGALPLVCALFALAVPGASARGEEPLSDAPIVWWEDDRRDMEEPKERDPNLLRDQIHTTVVQPLRRNTSPAALVRWIGTAFGGDRWPQAKNVNALDEVPNSTWFTNRIGLYPLTAADVARGPGDGRGPDTSEPWVVVGAKTEGVTPGFNIRDAQGQVYLIKFDPQGFLGTTSGPGVITGRLLHAAGYNVPDDAIVTFRREDLKLGEGVTLKEHGVERTMEESDLNDILSRVDHVPSGEFLALSSKFLDGTPVGPFDYKHRRKDDPNDRLQHQYRRELRGLRVVAAWVGHFDTKQHNTLDMYVEEDGARFVKHHLIDFASTLGSGARGAHRKNGWEYGFDGPDVLKRLLTVGLLEDDWRRLQRPEGIPEVGYFDTEFFDASSFEPLTPNTAFAMMNDRDGYWAAKIISAFSDEILAAVTATAHYSNPKAAPYVARVLAERRDILAREFFTRVCPVDFFRVAGDRLTATDLGVDRGIWTAAESTYRVRQWMVDADRQPRSPRPEWLSAPSPAIRLSGDGGFHAVEFQVSRGDEWSPSVIAYVSSASRRVVGVDR